MRALAATSCLMFFATALLGVPTARAAARLYRYDPVHSQILFSVDHDGYSRPFGRLHIARGWLRFDADDWRDAATELDIDLAGVDMGDGSWNRAVATLLDAQQARYAHFASTSVERIDGHHGVLHGRLTLRGITRAVDLPFTFNRQARTIYGMHTIAGFSATATLERDAFGITAYPRSIGHDVDVWLQIEAIVDDHAAAPRELPHAATH